MFETDRRPHAVLLLPDQLKLTLMGDLPSWRA
jgi:hypothetical protein